MEGKNVINYGIHKIKKLYNKMFQEYKASLDEERYYKKLLITNSPCLLRDSNGQKIVKDLQDVLRRIELWNQGRQKDLRCIKRDLKIMENYTHANCEGGNN